MVTEKIVLANPERFEKKHTISKDKLTKAAEAATNKLEANIGKLKDGFAGTCSVDYKYITDINKNWECGMQTGAFWLAYEITGNKIFKDVAEHHLSTYKTRLDEKIGMDDHDVGFVFTPSCVAAYKITGNELAREYALEAAKYLYEKSYSKEGKFIIRSHRSWAQGGGCRTMMDSLMNAPLFFWAAEETGKEEFYQAALDHNKTTMQYLIRDDASSFHHYQFDPETAKPVKGVTLQGYSDDSCWARGHSWGVYGFPIAYSYSGDESLVDTHKAITYYMLNRLPDDCITYWDYIFTQGSDQPRDSSSGAISVCGMNEMCKLLPDTAEQKPIFENASAMMLEAIIDKCTGKEDYDYDGLICHVTHAFPQGQGIDEGAIYGDYFYLEALLRYLKPDWKKYW